MDRDVRFEAAVEAFFERRYEEAREGFRALLLRDPLDRGAQMGMMLCDLVNESEEEAISLLDYYEVLRGEGERWPEEIIIDMIAEFDEAESELNTFYGGDQSEHQRGLEGIGYEDFKRIVEERGDFKKAYEDIMFSTKVFISDQDELFDFIDKLITHGYWEQVYTYIEDATRLYPNDKRLEELFEKLKR